jgi:hypothetical protein
MYRTNFFSISLNYFVVSTLKPADRGGCGGGCVVTSSSGDASGPQHGFAAVMTVRKYLLPASITCFKTPRSTRSPLNFDLKFQTRVDNCAIYVRGNLQLGYGSGLAPRSLRSRFSAVFERFSIATLLSVEKCPRISDMFLSDRKYAFPRVPLPATRWACARSTYFYPGSRGIEKCGASCIRARAHV